VNAAIHVAAAIARTLAGFYLRIFFGLSAEGAERVPRGEGGLILASNHASIFDPPVIACVTPRFVVFTPRSSLSGSWIYRIATCLMPVVALDRGKADLGATRRLVDLLREGYAVAIFPEETRTRTGRLGSLKGGFHLLARKAGVPVLPMYIHGSYEAWPRERTFPRRKGKIRVKFGEPMDLHLRPRAQAVRELEVALRGLAAQFENPTGGAAEDPPAPAPPPAELSAPRPPGT
jgi:1-acyl-sn-glycerol-3-phosphate acyltransferase